jgi:hypothetical protein
MTVFDLIIVPAILIASLFLGVFWLISKLVRAKVGMMNAERRASEVSPELLSQQGEVIYDVIAELEANKISYQDFPPELETRLMEAHHAWDESCSRNAHDLWASHKKKGIA